MRPARARHLPARRGAAGAARGRERGGLGVPAPGSAQILLLLLLVTAITLNLARLFELPSLGERGAPARRFFTGALAAFVATPCTGPFMGAALGAALVLPPAGRWWCSPRSASGSRCRSCCSASSPRCAAGCRSRAVDGAAPALPGDADGRDRARLPGLLWRQGGATACASALARRSLLGLILWWAGAARKRRGGRAGSPRSPRSLVSARRGAGRSRRAPAAAARVPLDAERVQRGPVGASSRRGPAGVRLFHRRLVPDLQGQRSRRDRTRGRRAPPSRKAGVVALVGDWTRGDAAIGRFLESRGRAGVPLYLWYAPGQAEPEVLPQILTPGDAQRPRSPAPR